VRRSGAEGARARATRLHACEGLTRAVREAAGGAGGRELLLGTSGIIDGHKRRVVRRKMATRVFPTPPL
jgi:hypothetical protein